MILFRGGRIVDPASGIDETSDILVEGSSISRVGSIGKVAGAEVIDVTGAIVAPGFVDMHVHLREPGREDEETIESGSAAAAKGGFTAICAMPNTNPSCDNATVAERVATRGAEVGFVRVVPSGALTKGQDGQELAAIGEMATSAVRVRLFTDDGRGVQDSRLLRRAMEYIKGFGGVCAEHCDDASLSAGGQMHEGEFSSGLGLKGIPAEAEEMALSRDLALVRMTGVRFHALHISTARSVDLIRAAKAEGLQVTAEATPHHLCLTDADLATFDTNLKVNPPLRPLSDVEAVRAGVADGTIDAIATDHAPHSAEEKEAEFELAPPGLVGLETALGVLVSELVNPGIITIAQLIERMSVAPSRILELDGFGGPLAEGTPANLCVFDPSEQWTVDPTSFESKSRNTPWSGKTLTGRVLHTVHAGQLVVRDSAVTAEALV